ncbi:MAG: Tol biopolymer transport system component [Pseudohongiellaceae bacterium]|jgi:Tol biopolymer transport system component
MLKKIVNFQIPLAFIISGLACSTTAAADELPLQGATDQLSFTVTEGSWVSVSLTPDDAYLVFDLLGDLYRLPVAGGQAQRITSGLGFDSQPVVSPDGQKIAFITDRSGKDNLWIAAIDGSNPIQLSDETYASFISPAWNPESNAVVVTRSSQEIELVQYHVDGGSGVTIAQSDDDSSNPPGVGAAFSPDGMSLYFAEELGSPTAPTDNFPTTQIVRLDLGNGARLQITQGEGGGVRPQVSPDGNHLIYGTRYQAQTGLRIRNLETGDDRWLAYPVQRDAQENFRPSSRGMLPGYSFSSDGSEIFLSADGQFQRINTESGNTITIPFSADIALEIGPDLTKPWRVPQGDFAATLAQSPNFSPDNEQIAASVLTRLYTLNRNQSEPAALTSEDMWAFQPVYSPDGRWIAFVTWTANDGGHIWKTRSNGRGQPQQLTKSAAFYTDIVWHPGGERLMALKGNEWQRHQTFSEFSGLGIPLELISIAQDGSDEILVMPAGDARTPHFGPEPNRLYLADGGTLFSVNLDGGDRRDHIHITGPNGTSFRDEAPGAEDVRISPNGKYVLAKVIKQLWVVSLPKLGASVPQLSVGSPSLPAKRLTDIGADFMGWSNGGDTINWAIGSSIFERPLSSVEFREADEFENDDAESEENETAFTPLDEHEAVVLTPFEVVTARNTPTGSFLLSGGNIITMSGDTTEEMSKALINADVLITDNRISAIGPQGSLKLPPDTEVIDVTGKWITPGFIDAHAHWEFRTQDVLEPSNWSVAINLAYGVTSGLDVQTTYHDYFAYRDMQETGATIGQRAFMTGPGIFGSNDFHNYDAVHSYLRRYRDHYNTNNIKSYLVGNRQQRQWLVQASQDLNLLPTTEGGGDQRLDLTHAIDGMHGNEHSLPDVPLFDDVAQLYARTKTAYTPTIIVQYNATSMTEYFFTREEIHDNEKLRYFYPSNRLDELTQRRPGWIRDDEFAIEEGAEAAAKIQRSGGLLGVGGHGELQGLGYHWEMWSFAMGGMSPAEILRAATIDGAHILGAPEDLGSIEVGKLADMVILNANPLDDIRNTEEIDRVVQNGRLFDANTLNQLWPEQTTFETGWWRDAEARP